MTPDVNVVISHSEYTVLVVDDVVSNVLLLKVLLTNEKFKVITAGNGKEALSQAVNARPDLILLDVMMPEMNGFEVAERLKAEVDQATKNTAIQTIKQNLINMQAEGVLKIVGKDLSVAQARMIEREIQWLGYRATYQIS